MRRRPLCRLPDWASRRCKCHFALLSGLRGKACRQGQHQKDARHGSRAPCGPYSFQEQAQKVAPGTGVAVHSLCVLGGLLTVPTMTKKQPRQCSRRAQERQTSSVPSPRPATAVGALAGYTRSCACCTGLCSPVCERARGRLAPGVKASKRVRFTGTAALSLRHTA